MYGVPGVSAFAAGAALPSLAAGGPPPVSFDLPKNVYRFGEQTLWSTQFITQGAVVANGVNRVFTTPLGQSGQGFTAGLTIAETNLKEGGRIPSGIAFDCFGISVSVGHSTAAADVVANVIQPIASPINTVNEIADLNNVITNSVLTWDFTQTQVDVCPTNLAGAGGGVFGALAAGGTNAATATGSLQNGNGAVWLYRKHPVALPGNSTFSMLIRFGSRAPSIGGTGCVAMRVVLLGYYKNVIEVA